MTDLLDHLDAMARTSLTVPGEIRAAWVKGIQTISDRDGTFDAARVRVIVPADCKHGSEIGALFRHLSKSGQAVMVGSTESGYTEHRAATTLIKVWRLTTRIQEESA